VTLRARWVTLRARWVTLRARWVTLRARWVTLRARWVTLRARWVTLRARWVTLRARWVTFTVQAAAAGGAMDPEAMHKALAAGAGGGYAGGVLPPHLAAMAAHANPHTACAANPHTDHRVSMK
jgi:hypothetical protein